MKIKEKILDNVSVVALSGNIMGETEIGELHSAIKTTLGNNTRQIVIDLKEVSWMGSLGVGMLICCLTTVRNAGGELKLSGLSEKVVKIFEMTRLNSVFDTFPGTNEAITSFK